MLKHLRRLIAAVTGFSFLLSGIALMPRAETAYRVLSDLRDPAVAAEIQLREVAPETFPRAIEDALAEDDAELADAIVALARERKVAIPSGLESRVAAALAAKGGLLSEVWNGAVFGEVHGAAGLAATVVTDFMVIGDVRDLVRQAAAYPDHDPVILALAVVGIGLTAASVSTAGVAAPVKAGASLLKAARRAGKLGARLSADLARLTARAIDWHAVDRAVASARKLDAPATRRAVQGILRREATDELTGLAGSLGSIARAQGPRAAFDTLAVAETATELRRLERVSASMGRNYRAALKVAPRLGKAVAKTSRIVLKLALWIGAAVAWLLWLAWTVLSLLRKSVRIAGRLARVRLAVRPGLRPSPVLAV